MQRCEFYAIGIGQSDMDVGISYGQAPLSYR